MRAHYGIFLLIIAAGSLCLAQSDEPVDKAVLEEMVTSVPHRAPMEPSKSGELRPGEYEIITPNGAVTRALCPYTCDMRGLPEKQCRSWQSANDPRKCYLQDLSLPADPVEKK